jgi:NADH-quinone oxidoreductase subunit N
VNPFDPNWALLKSDLSLVTPECILVIGMCLVLLVPFIKRSGSIVPTFVAALTLLVALFAVLVGLPSKEAGGMESYGPAFSNMLMIDPASQFFKIILLLFTMLVVLQWLLTTTDDVEQLDVPDFLCLLLGATLGMTLMASANSLLTIVIATETASLPSFALAGFRKKKLSGSEAALKYVLFGSVASAVMIYGASLVYGAAGTLHLGSLAAYAQANGVSAMMALGLAAVIAGIGFKLSAVPMHFWCPDVFEAAPIPVTTFLSVASKGAAVIMLLRLVSAFGTAHVPLGGLAAGIAVLGGVTATWGNLMAFHQNHLRRLLAYSSIAHAGYMIMGIAIAALPASGAGSISGPILFYLVVYMFMNLGAFTVGALIAQRTGTEDIREYAGLIKRSPVMTVLLGIFLLSLFGMPGLGGFMGKVFLALGMVKVGVGGIVLVAVLLINTLISLYFYMRPVYYMVLVPDTENRPGVPMGGAAMAVLVICAVMLVITGITPQYAYDVTQDYSLVNTQDARAARVEAPVQPVQPVAQLP